MVNVEKILYCSNGHDPLALVAKGPVACEKCKEQMREIGWMESDGKAEELQD